MKIAILGGGSWGSALAVHLAKKKHDIKVWEFFAEQAQEMQEKRVCKLLPEVELPSNIFISCRMEEVLVDSELILLAVPSDHAKITLDEAKKFLKEQPIIICSKGFANGLHLISEVIKEQVNGEIFCLYGPTHAEEVCKGMFSGIMLAGRDGKQQLKSEIESDTLRVELCDDIIGVQVASALKNVLAIFIGALEGAGYGDNTKAYILTKGLHEIKEVGLAWGAEEETFYGLAGIGDIIVTCGSRHSRNFCTGRELGKGRKLDDVLREMKMVAEGVSTARFIGEIKEKFKLNLPILSGICKILFEGDSVDDVLRNM